MKSGIELIQELLEEVKTLNKRFEITEQNVKLLLQKVNGQSQMASVVATISSAQIKSAPIEEPTILPPKSTNGTRVIGRIQDDSGRIITGLPVKIYNIGNQLVKETKTNRAGEWMCFLPQGVYYAKYQLEGKMPSQVDFGVVKDQSIVRVAAAK